jgi:urease gamma subunit
MSMLEEASFVLEIVHEVQDKSQQERQQLQLMKKTKKLQTTASVVEQVLQLYSNLIVEKARKPWIKIVSE